MLSWKCNKNTHCFQWEKEAKLIFAWFALTVQCFAGASSLVPYPRGQSHRQLTLSCILNNLWSSGFCCGSYKDSLVLFLSSLQSCSYTGLPQGQFWSELKTFVAFKKQQLCLSTAEWVGQTLIS